MNEQKTNEDLIMRTEYLLSGETVPTEYLEVIEDVPDFYDNIPDDYYNEFETPYFTFEEKEFIDKYLYEWIIEELEQIQYLYKEDPVLKEKYDYKIGIINSIRKSLTPLEIIAFDSCLGGNEVFYGSGEALKSVRRCAGKGNGLSGYGIEIQEFDDFYSRLCFMPHKILDELIDIIDNSEFLRDIRRGKLRKLMKEEK